MKIIILIFLVLISPSANAGFITGAIVGAVAGSAMSGSSEGNTQPQFISSDQHDVIFCHPYRMTNKCLSSGKSMTIDEFIKSSGYKTLHKLGVLFSNGTEYIIMEVSK